MVNERQTKYETDILPQLSDVSKWIMEGDSVRVICKKLHISPDTWYRYCKEHETLSELVNLGKSVLNNEVEKSLIKLCTGYEYEELKTIVEEDKSGKKHTKLEKNKRHQPPSAVAISFYLRNRCPEDWAEKKELVIDTSQNEQARKELFLEMIRNNESEQEEENVVDIAQE
ncbi:MAG: helix-turn-helix domain-containing protein [Clostridia bacterium]|nr:helix-turn-helix domain-containing protein [Clostridia bacterium]